MTKNKGSVLITTLIFALVALILFLGLNLIMVYQTRFSGILKRYSTALQAANGEAFICMEKIKKDCEEMNCPQVSGNNSHEFPKDIMVNFYHSENYGAYKAYCKIIDRKFFTTRFYHIEVVAFKPGTEDFAWLAIGYVLD